MTNGKCPECGALLTENKRCREYFDRMLAWDFEDFAGAGKNHHLTVLCYHIQHPALYSTETHRTAIGLLREIIEKNLSGAQLLEINRKLAANKQKITGTPENHGTYPAPVSWSMTADAVVKGGVEGYPERVMQWARSIYSDLLKAKQITAS